MSPSLPLPGAGNCAQVEACSCPLWWHCTRAHAPTCWWWGQKRQAGMN